MNYVNLVKGLTRAGIDMKLSEDKKDGNKLVSVLRSDGSVQKSFKFLTLNGKITGMDSKLLSEDECESSNYDRPS